MAMLGNVVVCLAFASVVYGSPVLSRVRRDEALADSYFRRFGYRTFGQKLGQLTDTDPKIAMYKAFQAMANIPQTGKYDNATEEAMNWPRCGVPDFGANSLENGKRKKRYAIEGSKWDYNSPITWYIETYTADLPKTIVDKEIERAFKVWSDVSRLQFFQVNSRNADIVIKFVRGAHGDGNPFDGSGNILAHAFFPRYGGDAHFDEDEFWTYREFRGKNLFQVAAHEFGHSLGLQHSEVGSSLMAPFYRGYVSDFKLDQDDIDGIQTLYGKPSSMTPPPGPTDIPLPATTRTPRPTVPTVQPPQPIPDFCEDGKFDAITNYKNGKTYAFRGDTYFKIGSNGVEEEHKIGERLIIVPDNLDSALYWPYNYDSSVKAAERLFFFKGDQVWEISSNQVSGPKFISQVFPGLPNDIDASFVWGGNGRTYFIKGNQYYRVARRADRSQQYRVDSGYPRPLSVWGFNRIDAVFQHDNGRTYFFTGTTYNRFNDYTFAVDKADPPYPRPNDFWWYGCSESGSIKDEDAINEDKDAQEHDQMETVTHNADATAGSRVTLSSQSQLVFFAVLSLFFYKLR